MSNGSRYRLWGLAVAVSLAAPSAIAERGDQPGDQTVVDLEITVDVEVGEPVMLAGADGTAYLKIGLTGFALPRASARAPVNLALVLDRSSSMSGDKLAKAKEAALQVVDRLGVDDILSIISYDSTVEVLVPATRVIDREPIRQRIRQLEPSGSTALFAGVSRGIEEVQKFLSAERVNRVILLSDGQANIGPSSPNELGRLGRSAGKLGIAITTIGLGLGYNEDLMTQIAMASDGNHAFAQSAEQLVAIFDHELGDVLSVVAQDVSIEVELDPGIRPLRSLQRGAEIHGNKVYLSLNQLYARQEKFFLLEVAVPAHAAGKRELAAVDVGYDNLRTKRRGHQHRVIGIEFSSSRAVVAKRQNRDVMIAAVEAIATDRNRWAVALRDQGKIQEAEEILNGNAAYLEREGKRLASPKLRKYGEDNKSDAENLEPEQWNQQRKQMREGQFRNDTQRSW